MVSFFKFTKPTDAKKAKEGSACYGSSKPRPVLVPSSGGGYVGGGSNQQQKGSLGYGSQSTALIQIPAAQSGGNYGGSQSWSASFPSFGKGGFSVEVPKSKLQMLSSICNADGGINYLIFQDVLKDGCIKNMMKALRSFTVIYYIAISNEIKKLREI
jgi:hypothetical protein